MCTGEKVDRAWTLSVILVIQLDVWAFNYHHKIIFLLRQNFSKLFQWIYKSSSIFSLCVNELHCVFHDVIWLDSGRTDRLFSKTYWLYSTVSWGQKPTLFKSVWHSKLAGKSNWFKYIKRELAIMTIQQILTRVRSDQIPLRFRLENSQKSSLCIVCVCVCIDGTNSTKKTNLSINSCALNTFPKAIVSYLPSLVEYRKRLLSTVTGLPLFSSHNYRCLQKGRDSRQEQGSVPRPTDRLYT